MFCEEGVKVPVFEVIGDGEGEGGFRGDGEGGGVVVGGFVLGVLGCGSLELGAEELDFLLGFAEFGGGFFAFFLLLDEGFHEFNFPGVGSLLCFQT